MPDQILSQDFELKLEEISMKIFENKKKKNRSNIRTSYRTDFNKPAVNFNDYYSIYNNDRMLMNLTNLTNLTQNLQIESKKLSAHKLKKSVRFADTLGQDLVKINEFVLYPSEDESKLIDSDESDEFFSDDSQEEDHESFEYENIRSKWKCCFDNPGLSPKFYNDLNDKKVLLEFVHANHNILEGTIRVINLNFHKKVSLRYTFDDWKTYVDSKCDYFKSLNFNHVQTDQFKFSVELDQSLIGKLIEENKYLSSTNEPVFKIHFAICYETSNDFQNHKPEVYWDNNSSKNYCFESYLQMIF